MRIMAKYDFKIVATWESKRDNRTEFIYLLEWPDKQTMTDRWERFCGIRNGLRSRRRQPRLTDRSWERFRIGPCIWRIIHRVRHWQNETGRGNDRPFSIRIKLPQKILQKKACTCSGVIVNYITIW